MKKYQFGICGAFDFEKRGIGGQSVKTMSFYQALCDAVGAEKVYIVESTGYKNNPFVFVIKFIAFVINCKNIIILPADKGIKVFAPLCVILGSLFNTKVHYNVIGGWLAKLISNDGALLFCLKRFNSILVETSTMKNSLDKYGLKNVFVLANFKQLTPVKEIKNVSDPVRLCYFSRVAKQKGIGDAINVVKMINQKERRCMFDIYGPVVPEYMQEFLELQKKFSDEIAYKGEIDPKDSVKTLQKYDLQLFPTHYYTEGIPGSILDSFFAATPVVAAKWESFSDLIQEGKTGVGFQQGDSEDFFHTLNTLLLDKQLIMKMKKNCLQEAEKYSPSNVINRFLEIVSR